MGLPEESCFYCGHPHAGVVVKGHCGGYPDLEEYFCDLACVGAYYTEQTEKVAAKILREKAYDNL